MWLANAVRSSLQDERSLPRRRRDGPQVSGCSPGSTAGASRRAERVCACGSPAAGQLRHRGGPVRKTIAYSGQASVPQSAETTLRAMYTSCVSGWASVARLVGDLAGRQGGVVQPRATVLRKRCDVTPERAGGASQLLALAVECALSLGISAYLGDQRLAALAFHDRGGSTCRPHIRLETRSTLWSRGGAGRYSPRSRCLASWSRRGRAGTTALTSNCPLVSGIHRMRAQPVSASSTEGILLSASR
jgi:hypothetical protein